MRARQPPERAAPHPRHPPNCDRNGGTPQPIRPTYSALRPPPSHPHRCRAGPPHATRAAGGAGPPAPPIVSTYVPPKARVVFAARLTTSCPIDQVRTWGGGRAAPRALGPLRWPWPLHARRCPVSGVGEKARRWVRRQGFESSDRSLDACSSEQAVWKHLTGSSSQGVRRSAAGADRFGPQERAGRPMRRRSIHALAPKPWPAPSLLVHKKREGAHEANKRQALWSKEVDVFVPPGGSHLAQPPPLRQATRHMAWCVRRSRSSGRLGYASALNSLQMFPSSRNRRRWG